VSERRPVVAIVGRPNVGKSTLFNRWVGQQRSIVADEPGVTRDRIYADATLRGETRDYGVVLVDTGGLDPSSSDVIAARILDQTELAIEEADVVVFVVDGRAGLTDEDRRVAQRLRRAQKPHVLAVNKLDGLEHGHLAAEFFRLGVETTLAISAAHGREIRALEEELIAKLPEWAEPIPDEVDDDDADDDAPASASEGEPAEGDAPSRRADPRPPGPIRIAVIGRPNVGKSSLVNRLLGEDRHLVSEVAGTTRDAVDSVVEFQGKPYILVDTAGIRRKRSIALRLEQFSVFAALKGLERADVALLVLDPTQGLADQDAKISAFAFEKGKAVILVISKWDTQRGVRTIEDVKTWVSEQLPHLDYAPILVTSAHTGFGVERLFPLVDAVFDEHARRVPTGELNRLVEALEKETPPQSRKGRRGRIYYLRQIGVRPRRFLINTLRERYGFAGVPVLVGYRARKKKKKPER
jgi:GTP-binding protein